MADGERLKLLSLQAELSQPSGPVDEDKQQLNVRSLLPSKYSRNYDDQKIQILINEKNRELDQLKFELQSLKMLEAQQSEFLLMCKRM